jgi:hypothetical protein
VWDIAAQCLRPVHVEQAGFGHHFGDDEMGFQTREGWEQGRRLNMMVPCRQCSECLHMRKCWWGKRAIQEWEEAKAISARTWFGTMTVSPENRYRLIAATRLRLEAHGQTLEELPPVERFREMSRDFGPLATKFFWRARRGLVGRKIPPMKMRYFLTMEPHKDWVPHFHCLIHEATPLHPIRKAHLEHFWPHGHAVWRLIHDESAAFYAAKYLGKYSVARVRASEYYGLRSKAKNNTFSEHR